MFSVVYIAQDRCKYSLKIIIFEKDKNVTYAICEKNINALCHLC